MKNMKIKISLFMLFFVLCNSGYGQIKSWKQIDVPVKRTHIIKYVSEDSTYFTHLSDSQDLYSGKSIFHDSMKYLFKGNPTRIAENGKYILFLIGNTIHRYDKKIKEIQTINLSFNANINNLVLSEEFIFLTYNGNLTKLNLNGEIIKEASNFNGNLLLYDSKLYLKKTNGKIEIYDLNLNLLKTTNGINQFIPIVEAKNSALMTLYQYSLDEGNTWKNFNSPFHLTNLKAVNSKSDYTFRIKNDSLMYWANVGANLNLIKLPFIPTSIFISKTNDIFIQKSNYSGGTSVFQTNIKALNWKEVIVNTNLLSTSFEIATGNNENIVYSHYFGGTEYKFNENNSFEKNSEFSFGNPLYANNNSFLLNVNGNIYRSKNKGQNWNKIVVAPYSYATYITQKRENSIVVTFDSILVSSDQFDTRLKYNLLPQMKQYNDRQIAVTEKLNVFAFEEDYINNSTEILIHHQNLLTGEYYKHTFDKLDSLILYGSFHTEFIGNTCYLYAGNKNTSGRFIIVTDDNFKTQKVKKLPIAGILASDHQSNLYIFRDNYLAVSENKGDTWKEIGQNLPAGTVISDVQVSPDHYLYLVSNKGILKSNETINKPSTIEIALHFDTNKDCIYDNDELFTLADIKVKVNDSDFLTPNADGIIRYETPLEKNKIQFYYDTLDLSLCIADSLTFDVGVGLPETKRLDVGYNRLPKCPKLTASLEKLELKNCSANTLIFKICNNGRADAEDVLFESTLPYLFGHVEHVNDPFGSFDWWVKTKIPKLKVNECKNYIINYDIDCNTPIQDICITGKLTHKTLCGQSFELKHCAKNYTWNNDFTQRVIFNGKEINSNSSIAVNNSQPQLFTFENNMIYNGTDSLFSIQIEDEFSDLFDLNTITVLQNSLPYSLSTEDGKLLISMKGQTQNGRIHQFFYTIKTKNNIKSGDVLNIESFVNFDKDWHGYWRDYKFNVEISNATSEWDGDHFVIYPNPFESTLIINSQNQDDFSLKIYNTQGQVLYHQESITSGTALNLQEIPSQLLYIELTYKNNQRAYTKVVKY